MKKIISLLLTLVLTTFCFTITAGAAPAQEPIDLYEQDIVFTNSLAFTEPVIYYQPYSRMLSDEWDSAPMAFVQFNNYGEGMYYFNFPDDQVYHFYISDAVSDQRTELLTRQENDTLELYMYGDINSDGYYNVAVRHVNSENLIVLDNTCDTLSDDIYICCHCIDPFTGDGSDIRAKMERADYNDYGEGRYRFTVPNGTQSFYFTDGEKHTEEIAFSGTEWFYLPGEHNADGKYKVYYVSWAGGPDPVWSMGPSHTIFDRFNEEYVSIYTYDVNPEAVFWADFFYLYDEVYEHHDSSGDADWALIHTESFIAPDVIYYGLLGNRFVYRPTPSSPFESGYGIYDVKQDIFVPITSDAESKYDGLTKVLDEVVAGRLLGDLDGDDSITVIDATILQRCEAKMRDYPEDDELSYPYGKIRYYSDFNRDGERDITDATCIQRYLVNA